MRTWRLAQRKMDSVEHMMVPVGLTPEEEEVLVAKMEQDLLDGAPRVHRLPSIRTPSQAAVCAVLVSECGVPSPAAPHSRTRVAASAERLAKAPELGPTDCICSGTHFETQQEAIEHMARKVRAATAASRAFIRQARAFLRRARSSVLAGTAPWGLLLHWGKSAF